MKKAIIFDLDGTMWDSSEAVTAAYNLSLKKQGIPLSLTVGDIRAAMGKTMVEIAHMYFDAIDKDRAVEIMTGCIDEENAYLITHSGVTYPDLEATLAELRRRGWFLACVSNCQSGYIEAFYAATGLGHLFDDKECWGGTGLPKADNIKIVAERNGIGFAVYVGDTMGDYDSARAAGAAFIHASYGYGTVPDGTPRISELKELPDLADNFLSSDNPTSVL